MPNLCLKHAAIYILLSLNTLSIQLYNDTRNSHSTILPFYRNLAQAISLSFSQIVCHLYERQYIAPRLRLFVALSDHPS